MRLLLDTQVLLWAASMPERLGGSKRMLTEADVRLVSVASAWELAIKSGIGKLDLKRDIASWLRRALRELVAEPLDIRLEHTFAIEGLPPAHRDPFDRMLVAQAAAEGAQLLTADKTLLRYGDMVRLIT